MQDTAGHLSNDQLGPAEQALDKLELTAAAIRLGIGVDGVRRRLQRGSLRGVKEEGKWFVLLPAEHLQDDTTPGAEHPNQSSEQDGEVPAERYIAFLEAQNEKLWKEIEERRREVSELHILLRREQEQQELKALPAPVDYVMNAQQPQNTAERPLNKRRGWWRLFNP